MSRLAGSDLDLIEILAQAGIIIYGEPPSLVVSETRCFLRNLHMIVRTKGFSIETYWWLPGIIVTSSLSIVALPCG